MKRWIKFFGLSFFSDDIAKSAPKFGFVSVFLAVFLSFLFIMFGFYASDVIPFGTHYRNAESYREFIRAAFDNGIGLTIENGKGISGTIVNTYKEEADAAAYGKNGYNLIVDTRPSDTLIEFEEAAFKGDDGENKISYEEYLALDSQAQKEYQLAVGFTGELLEITSDDTQMHIAYLEEISKETSGKYNQDGAEDYLQLKENRANYSDEEYGKELYYLYVKYYYTNVGSIYGGAKAPVLRDYYYSNYITKGNAYYFYVFDDICAGSFETDNKIPIVFGGYFNKCTDGKVTDIDELIVGTFYDTVGNTFVSYFVSAMSQLPVLIFIPLILGCVMWLVGKAVQSGLEQSFAGCYKTVSSFVWASALLTALIVFIGGFFTSARLMYNVIPIIFGGVLLIRTIIFCIVITVKNRKQLAQSRQENNQDIFGGNI